MNTYILWGIRICVLWSSPFFWSLVLLFYFHSLFLHELLQGSTLTSGPLTIIRLKFPACLLCIMLPFTSVMCVFFCLLIFLFFFLCSPPTYFFIHHVTSVGVIRVSTGYTNNSHWHFYRHGGSICLSRNVPKWFDDFTAEILQVSSDVPNQKTDSKADNSWIQEITSYGPLDNFHEQIRDFETKRSDRIIWWICSLSLFTYLCVFPACWVSKNILE